MSRKTKKHRHKHSVHHRRHKRRYSHGHSIHHRKKTRIRKKQEISIIPGSKAVPIFTAPNKKNSELILVNVEQPTGNIVPGLRNYMKNM